MTTTVQRLRRGEREERVRQLPAADLGERDDFAGGPPESAHHIATIPIEPPVAVSEVGDPAEQEAEQVAAEVLSPTSEGALTGPLVSPASVPAGPPPGGPAAPGEPLDATDRAFFEPRFGHDFSQVRIFSDGDATRDFGALAYTHGTNVVIRPDIRTSSERQQTLAHELAHVVQQTGGAPADGAARVTPGIGAVPGQRTVQRQPDGNAPPQPAAPAAQPASGAPTSSAPPGVKVIQPPDPGGPQVSYTHTDGTLFTFSENEAYVQSILEQYVADKGLGKLDGLGNLSGLWVGGVSGMSTVGRREGQSYGTGLGVAGLGGTANQQEVPDGLVPKVQAVVKAQVAALQRKVAAFRDDYQRRANDTLNALLDDSQARLEKEREKYGIKEKDWIITSTYSMAENDETKDLQDKAKGLQPKREAVKTIWDELNSQPPLIDEEEAAPDPTGAPKSGHRNQYKVLKEREIRDRLEKAEKEYNVARGEAERLHPSLVMYQLDALSPTTAGHLSTLASGSNSDRAKLLGSELKDRLKNIEKVRKQAADDKSYVWKLDKVKGVTNELPDIKNHRELKNPGIQSTVVAERTAEITFAEEAVKAGIAAVIIGLGIIAAAPTGGLSVAAATAVAAAGTAEAGLLLASTYGAIKDYQLKSAENETDLDKAKAISQEEPSLFWIAVDIILVFPAAKGGVKAASTLFRRISALRAEAASLRVATLAGDAAKIAGPKDEYERALKQLEELGDQSKAGNGKKLREEVESGKAGNRGTSAEGSGPSTRPEEPPPGHTIARGADNFPLSVTEAHTTYYNAINANKGREYALLRHRRTGSYAVVYGEAAEVSAPAAGLYGERLLRPTAEWEFVVHYHPESVYFGNRLPSLKDLRGVFGESAGGTKAVVEGIDWFDMTANKLRRTRYGYTPGEIEPFWVEFANESGILERRTFAAIEADAGGLIDASKTYNPWLQPHLTMPASGPATVRTPK